MFDEWFETELADAVVDLVPEDALSEDDLETLDVQAALTSGAWCGGELPDRSGRLVAFELPHRELFEAREGRVLDLLARNPARIVRGIVTPRESDSVRDGGGSPLPRLQPRLRAAHRAVGATRPRRAHRPPVESGARGRRIAFHKSVAGRGVLAPRGRSPAPPPGAFPSAMPRIPSAGRFADRSRAAW